VKGKAGEGEVVRGAGSVCRVRLSFSFKFLVIVTVLGKGTTVAAFTVIDDPKDTPTSTPRDL